MIVQGRLLILFAGQPLVCPVRRKRCKCRAIRIEQTETATKEIVPNVGPLEVCIEDLRYRPLASEGNGSERSRHCGGGGDGGLSRLPLARGFLASAHLGPVDRVVGLRGPPGLAVGAVVRVDLFPLWLEFLDKWLVFVISFF